MGDTRAYITLLEPGDSDSAGTIIDNDPIAVAAADARMLPFVDLLIGGHALISDLVDGTSGYKLAAVEPLSDPVECSNGASCWYEAPVWRVTGPAPWAEVFGPQGAEVIEALALISPTLQGRFGASPPAARYYALQAETGPEIDTALYNALEALDRAGADRSWWEDDAWQCGLYGPELVAIAARDLIGTVPGWTNEAHDTMTAPYRAAFGDDAPGAKKLEV